VLALQAARHDEEPQDAKGEPPQALLRVVQ
jgi:hypothetical protein